MRIVLLSAVFCVCFSVSALADGRAFPPDHCSPGAPFMAFSGINGSNTFCDSGQDILSSALLPGCAANQQVIYDGSKFICKDEPNVPTCPDGQVLTFLTGNGFTCVNANAQVPNCTANQFLTYSGGAFQCASVQNITIPTCGPNQVVSANGSTFTCIDNVTKPANGTLCGSAFWETHVDDPAIYNLGYWATCQGQNIIDAQAHATCPTGYALTQIAYSWGYNPEAFYYHQVSCAAQ